MAAHRAHAGEQILAEFGDVARLFDDALLPPHRRDGASDGDQISGRRQQHPFFEGEIPQALVGLQRGGEEMFAGDEEDDIFGRGIELGPIGLVAQLIDVRFQ